MHNIFAAGVLELFDIVTPLINTKIYANPHLYRSVKRIGLHIIAGPYGSTATEGNLIDLQILHTYNKIFLYSYEEVTKYFAGCSYIF